MRSLFSILIDNVKKFFVLFVLLFFSFAIKAQVVINELGIAPTTGNGANGGEFIELYNKGAGSVDISCYVIVFAGSNSAQAWTISIPSNTILACGDYYLIGGAGNAPSPTSAWVNTTVGGKAWINNYLTNGITTITSTNGLNINAAKCTGKGSLPPGNLADPQGQVSLLTSSGLLVTSVSYNNGNYSSVYTGSFSNPAASCTAINPIPSIPNSVANVNGSFSSSGNQGIYLDATGNYVIETELTPGKSNALNTTDGASQIASTCCVNPTITTQPSTAAQSLCLNAASTTLIVVATPGSGTIASNGYQWYRNTTASNTGGTIISGATSSTYTPPTTAVGTTYYYCVVTNTTGCSTTSNVSGAVIIKAATSSTTTISNCISYTWNGVTYTTSGTYTKTLVNATGCDSVATLNLTIKQPTTNNFNHHH